ncbi:hypothetical protein ABT324_24455 [Saccharopolyspora sp. NPDC000359]|uniref:hypothetical protein n=1 Tax=Saccharopolyspora sp. NPDC000359 TaxID=3154251 RepID=UPI00332148CF
MNSGNHYFYSGWGSELLEVIPRQRGAQLTITVPSPHGETTYSVTLTRDQFQRLLTDGVQILQKVDAIRNDAMRKRGYPL